MTIIPESDVYRLIHGSTQPAAERFQDWVYEEVLPSIRKTGAYVATRASAGPTDGDEGVRAMDACRDVPRMREQTMVKAAFGRIEAAATLHVV